jgi:hypothetical protein
VVPFSAKRWGEVGAVLEKARRQAEEEGGPVFVMRVPPDDEPVSEGESSSTLTPVITAIEPTEPD